MFSLPTKFIGSTLSNNIIPTGIALKGCNLLINSKYSSLSPTSSYQLQTSPLQNGLSIKNKNGMMNNYHLKKNSIRFYADSTEKKEKVKSDLRIQIIPAGPLSVNCCIINDEKSKEVYI